MKILTKVHSVLLKTEGDTLKSCWFLFLFSRNVLIFLPFIPDAAFLFYLKVYKINFSEKLLISCSSLKSYLLKILTFEILLCIPSLKGISCHPFFLTLYWSDSFYCLYDLVNFLWVWKLNFGWESLTYFLAYFYEVFGCTHKSVTGKIWFCFIF